MDLDLTVIFQVTIFVTLLFILNRAIFKPFMRVLEERHRKVHEAKQEAARLEREAATTLEAYQSRLRAARGDAQKEREALIGAGRSKERKLLAEVRAEIARSLNQTRTEVSQAELEASRNLSHQTGELARSLVAKVLGRELAP